MTGQQWYIAMTVLLAQVTSCSRLLTVPTTPFQQDNSCSYYLTNLKSIILDYRYGYVTDEKGQTLIPPTLSEFAETFQADLEEALGLELPLRNGSSNDTSDAIFITLDLKPGIYLDAAGRETSEGYNLTIDSTGITISGASPLGAWWGTRSVIQAAVTNKQELPCGSGIDAPGWATRGIMLDVARHYYPPDFIIEMCSYLSFFKQNVFHLHLNDNLFINEEIMSKEEIMSLYATFRLWSDDKAVSGLNRRANESYSKTDFENMQQKCAQRGVTIIPEIDLPAHALAVVQWKPELALQGNLSNLSYLNLSYPETLPTIKTIWKTFLPWFHSKRIHIGADEYPTNKVAEYTDYVDELSSFISQLAGQESRIWADKTPAQGSIVNKNVSIQYWANYLGNALFDYIDNGYSVVNSDFVGWYISEKWSAYFPSVLGKQAIFHGNPDGGQFSPNILDTRNASNNAARDNPLVEGHIMAAWNDFGPLTSTYLEAYYSWRDALPALADKQWGGNITETEYDSIFEKLHAVIPGQNLDRYIHSESDLIASYQFESREDGSVIDHSGNGYHATSRGCSFKDGTVYLDGTCAIDTPLLSKGRNGTLSFSVYPTSNEPAPLFSSSDSVLVVGGNVTLLAAGNPYPLNYSFPLNTWTNASLILRGDQTFLGIGDEEPMEFLTRFEPKGVASANGVIMVWASIGIELPFAKIGEKFKGKLANVQLKAIA